MVDDGDMPIKDLGARREYQRAYQAQWYTKNREKHQATVRRSKAATVARHRALVDEIKSGPCQDCFGVFDPVCMDFDHNGSVKLGNISTMLLAGWGWDRLKAEIDKCDLVCANCHRIRTKRGWRKGVSPAS